MSLFPIIIIHWMLCIHSVTVASAALVSTLVATFYPQSYLSLDIASGTISSSQDSIAITFRTKEENAFLYYSGRYSGAIQPEKRPSYYTAIYLLDGSVRIDIEHGGGTPWVKNFSCQSKYHTCADNRFHTLVVKRNLNTSLQTAYVSRQIQMLVRIVLDDLLQEDTPIVATSYAITSKLLLWAGFPEHKFPYHVPLKIKSFTGCMKKIEYSADNVHLNVLELASRKDKVDVFGRISFTHGICDTLIENQPVSFLPQPAALSAFLVLDGWSTSTQGFMEFSFRTSMPNCLLIYQESNRMAITRSDFIAFELREGRLYFLINTGSGTDVKSISSNGTLNDNIQHTVSFSYNEGHCIVLLDALKQLEYSRNGYKHLNLNNSLYIGGMPDHLWKTVPHEVWSATLRLAFRGCFNRFQVDQQVFDLALEKQLQNPDGIQIGCLEPTTSSRRQSQYCTKKPCQNNGICRDVWNGYQCDCLHTNFTGLHCNKKAPIVNFNGRQYVRVDFGHMVFSEVEDITLRLRTRSRQCLLIVTHSPNAVAKDRLELSLIDGFPQIYLDFGDSVQKFNTTTFVSDGTWHLLKLSRRKSVLRLQVDDNRQNRWDLKGISKLASYSVLDLVKLDPHRKPFIGEMMHFQMNGLDYFQQVGDKTTQNVEFTASISESPSHYVYPIYFNSTESYLELTPLSIFEEFVIQFWFRTTKEDGLLMLLNSSETDFLILELVPGGALRLQFQMGGDSRKRVSRQRNLHDLQWHFVHIQRQTSPQPSVTFRVDDIPQGQDAIISVYPNFTKHKSSERLFLGGLPEIFMKHRQLRGFSGCMASLHINRTSSRVQHSTVTSYSDPLQLAIKMLGVENKCPGGRQECHSKSCHYGGRCIQRWQSWDCDCSMTSFEGLTCSKVAPSWSFSDIAGYILFELTPSRNTTRDEIAFGMQSTARRTMRIFYVGGEASGGDFISMGVYMDKGRAVAQVEFNMGTKTFSLIETSVDVCDGTYHRWQFIRDGQMGWLKIDEKLPIILNPPGKQGNQFNNMKRILVGRDQLASSLYRVRREISDLFAANLISTSPLYSGHYSGYLSGLTVNKIPLIHLDKGEKWHGIDLMKKWNVRLEEGFQPSLDGFPPTSISATPISTSDDNLEKLQLDRNDSAQQSASEKDITSNNGDNTPKSDGLIVAKPDCLDNSVSVDNFRCSTSQPPGIVIPTLRFTFTTSSPTTTSSTSTVKVSQSGSVSFSSRVPARVPSDTNNSKNDVNIPGQRSAMVQVIDIYLVGIIAGGGAVAVFFVFCIIYKCRRSRSEGSYDVGNVQPFLTSTPLVDGGLPLAHYGQADGNVNGNIHRPTFNNFDCRNTLLPSQSTQLAPVEMVSLLTMSNGFVSPNPQTKSMPRSGHVLVKTATSSLSEKPVDTRQSQRSTKNLQEWYV